MKISVVPSVAMVALVSAGADAFVPVSPPTTTRPAVQQAKSSFVSSPVATMGIHHHGGPSSSTTLAMQGNLFDRFVRVFNANANKIVSKLEDPEKVIIQAGDDIQVSVF